MTVILYIIRGILSNKNYIGINNNLQRRLREHRSGGTKGGQITGNFKLIYTEKFDSYISARQREKFFKTGNGREWIKNYMLKHDPPSIDKPAEQIDE